jgi:hypothetical protein
MKAVTYTIGKTKVNVIKTDERGQSGRIHTGIVVGQTNSFLRVFNPDVVERGGEISPLNSQWYAINAPKCRCEVVGELKEALKLPADI